MLALLYRPMEKALIFISGLAEGRAVEAGLAEGWRKARAPAGEPTEDEWGRWPTRSTSAVVRSRGPARAAGSPPTFPCHFGHQNSAGTPSIKLAFWSPLPTPRVGLRKGLGLVHVRPGEAVAAGASLWGCCLCPSTLRLAFSCPNFPSHSCPLHCKAGLWVPSVRGRSKWRRDPRPWC